MALWSGRFSGTMDEAAWLFNASIQVDQRMAAEDVKGSMAWAGQLYEIGVLSKLEYEEIQSGLKSILDEIQSNEFIFEAGDEDIHSAVERRLFALIGENAGKLHTGRSRNDQVATDFRLWVLNHIPVIISKLIDLQSCLIHKAEENPDQVMPAYTHLQRAQPILLSHWWLSHFWALERDVQRWKNVLSQTSVLPLGSGAVAGSGFPVDREKLASELGFLKISPNSIDAVSDRDFAAEFLFAASMTATHISKLSEAVVLFTSMEFGYMVLDDAFSTGSSLMPQKKNPDVFELARGKAGTMLGLLTGLMSTLKGLPSTYDKDLQEDKYPVFAAFDYLSIVLPVLTGALESITIQGETMEKAVDSSMFATDLADHLVEIGIPFREAHKLVANAVRFAIEEKKNLSSLTKDELNHLDIPLQIMEKDNFSVMTSINRKNLPGGTAKKAVLDQIKHARRCVEENNKIYGGNDE